MTAPSPAAHDALVDAQLSHAWLPKPADAGVLARWSVFLYGVVCYAIFFGTFLYAYGFVGNILVPKAIDSPAQGSFWLALLVNAGLLLLFAVQHSVMARPGFKRWWTRLVPAPTERSTYVLFSSLALILLFWLWRPMGVVIWDVQQPVAYWGLYALFTAGWLLVLISTFLINHFDLFGLRQAWLYFRGREYTPVRFAQPWLYRVIRHPLYLGWLIAFWATPTMTVAHLVFAIGTTAYILIAIPLEERDLEHHHGEAYAQWRRSTPALLPIPRRRTRARRAPEGTAPA